MPLADFLADLDQLLAAARSALDRVADPAALEVARIEFLGAKSGRMKAAQKALGGVAKADRPAAGKRFHEIQHEIE
ncbi:MAG: phenylalanine--tRNA ligase subunit alpha, partial [Pirellulales bacterium]